jgi:hypothetical protein
MWPLRTLSVHVVFAVRQMRGLPAKGAATELMLPVGGEATNESCEIGNGRTQCGR